MSCSRTQCSDVGDAPPSRVKHSTTEPLRSLIQIDISFESSTGDSHEISSISCSQKNKNTFDSKNGR